MYSEESNYNSSNVIERPQLEFRSAKKTSLGLVLIGIAEIMVLLAVFLNFYVVVDIGSMHATYKSVVSLWLVASLIEIGAFVLQLVALCIGKRENEGFSKAIKLIIASICISLFSAFFLNGSKLTILCDAAIYIISIVAIKAIVDGTSTFLIERAHGDIDDHGDLAIVLLIVSYAISVIFSIAKLNDIFILNILNLVVAIISSVVLICYYFRASKVLS